MRFTASLAIVIVGATLSNALPAPQDDLKFTSSTAALPTAASTDLVEATKQIDQLLQFAQHQANATLSDNASKRSACNINTVAVRREWGSMSKSERKAYTDAVICLQEKTANTPSSLVPGAKSRFDDWVAAHINQTLTIHYTGTFLAWHRYFTWQYEQALRDECGYKGYQPYWDWAKTVQSGLERSPIFDGSDSSMSGNGEVVPDQGQIIIGGNGLPEIPLPSGSGGGCVKTGPFKDMKVNLGPVSMQVSGGTTIGGGPGTGLNYNPRCLKRDLTNYANKKWANATSLVSLILENNDIESFQMTMQGVPGSGQIGVHGGGHYAIGGDPGRDLFVSPGDPVFYLHHSMIDRTWWIWQQLDRKTRTSGQGISGTGTFLNQPPSDLTTLDTVVDLGYAAGPPVKMADIMDTTGGPMCYIYL